jgi:hypothetical protein
MLYGMADVIFMPSAGLLGCMSIHTTSCYFQRFGGWSQPITGMLLSSLSIPTMLSEFYFSMLPAATSHVQFIFCIFRWSAM